MKAKEWLSGLKTTQPKPKASCGKSPQLMSKSETLTKKKEGYENDKEKNDDELNNRTWTRR